MDKKLTIFDYLNNLFYKKGLVYDKKIASAYMITMFLSHDKSLLPIIDKINHLHFHIDDHLIYQYYYNTIPKGKRFLQYIKKDKTKDKETLKTQYKLSKNEYQYYKVMEGI